MGPINEFKQKNFNFKDLCTKLVTKAFPDYTESDVLFGNKKIYLKLDFESKWEAKRFDVIVVSKAKISKVAAMYKGIKVREMVRNWKIGANLFYKILDIKVKEKLISASK